MRARRGRSTLPPATLTKLPDGRAEIAHVCGIFLSAMGEEMSARLVSVGGMTPIVFAAYVAGEKWQGRNREYQPPAASLRVGDCRHEVGLRRGT